MDDDDDDNDDDDDFLYGQDGIFNLKQALRWHVH